MTTPDPKGTNEPMTEQERAAISALADALETTAAGLRQATTVEGVQAAWDATEATIDEIIAECPSFGLR